LELLTSDDNIISSGIMELLDSHDNISSGFSFKP
jgi:hypothetical protein